MNTSERFTYIERINTLPAYSCAEAGRFLGIPITTVRAWIRGQYYTTKAGEKLFRLVIIPAETETGYLSFQNLVELFVLKSIRRIHGVPLKKVRSALERLRTSSNTLHPLSDVNLLTDRSDLFIEHFDDYLNLSRDGQLEIKEDLRQCVRKIEKDPNGIPLKIFPQGTRSNISIDPRINFGRPSLVGVGIPTEILFERHTSGENVDFLAVDYRCDKSLIQEAIDYESTSREKVA